MAHSLSNLVGSEFFQSFFNALLQRSEKARDLLQRYLPASLNNPTAQKGLALLAGLLALYQLNRTVNKRALNNYASDPSWDWQKEIVLVTGGASGIGELMARQFASRGIKVIVLDVNPPRSSLPSNVAFYQADITSSETVHKVANKIRKEHGEVTVLINNAGIGYAGSILDVSEANIRKTFEVNTIAHYILAKEFLPSMIFRNHGHIVTIASCASFVTIAGNVEYSGSKAAAMAFYEGLTQELKHVYKSRRVRTSIVYPFWIRTPLTEQLIAQPHFKDPVLDAEYVAQQVVSRVLTGNAFQLVLPKSYSWSVSLLRAMPNWFQERVRDAKADVLIVPTQKA
ncbi:putative short-chain dehydrogenase/reductase 2 [Xylogone sp. PMI_703]|nr:putative short-chain dehydrogenase/reductase 2 [Xylogone sp. PMI_703]